MDYYTGIFSTDVCFDRERERRACLSSELGGTYLLGGARKGEIGEASPIRGPRSNHRWVWITYLIYETNYQLFGAAVIHGLVQIGAPKPIVPPDAPAHPYLTNQPSSPVISIRLSSSASLSSSSAPLTELLHLMGTARLSTHRLPRSVQASRGGLPAAAHQRLHARPRRGPAAASSRLARRGSPVLHELPRGSLLRFAHVLRPRNPKERQHARGLQGARPRGPTLRDGGRHLGGHRERGGGAGPFEAEPVPGDHFCGLEEVQLLLLVCLPGLLGLQAARARPPGPPAIGGARKGNGAASRRRLHRRPPGARESPKVTRPGEP
eukprot:1175897-Prorocentrum_minimum.AAC.1